MKWIKYLSGKKAGEIVQIDDAAATALLDSGVAEASQEPAAVTQKATELTGSLQAFVEDQIAKGLDAGFERIAAELKPGAKGKRPVIGRVRDNADDDPAGGFKGLNDFARTVHKACTGQGVDERLHRIAKANGASENIAADGGYAVPVEYATTIFNDITAQDSLMNQCTTLPMSGNSIKLPAINYTQQGQFGVTANWEGEGVTIPTSKQKYRQPQLTLNKLTCMVPVTSELLEDGIAVESLINFLASEAITYKVNDAILNGTGAGQPAGIVGHGSTVVVSRATANTVKAADVISMNSQFWGNEDRAQWLISKGDVEPQLLTMQDPNGRYLYFAPGSFNQDPRGKLLGKAVRPVINCAALGSHGDIILADLKSYVVGYKSTGVNKAMSIHLYFATDEVAYRWTFRMDGRPWRDTTLTAAKASVTYGTTVTL